MPRISVCINIADKDKQGFSAENDNIDYCKKCIDFVEVSDLRATQGLLTGAYADLTDEQLQHAIDENSDCDHPCYSECDYTCSGCGKPLTREDN